MHYFEIIIKANTELAEILTAELAEIGYNYFSDEDNQLKAYTETAEIDFQELNEVVEKYQFMGAELVSTQKIEKVNSLFNDQSQCRIPNKAATISFLVRLYQYRTEKNRILLRKRLLL